MGDDKIEGEFKLRNAVSRMFYLDVPESDILKIVQGELKQLGQFQKNMVQAGRHSVLMTEEDPRIENE